MKKTEYGKGSRIRPFDQAKWDKNWEEIFGKSKTKSSKKSDRRRTKKPKGKN